MDPMQTNGKKKNENQEMLDVALFCKKGYPTS